MIDFNYAESQNSFDLIPANTIAKARLVLKAGNDQTDHFITRSKNGDTAYLNCEWIILEGKYAKRKIFDKIGLEGSDRWTNMGKARIRAILESAKGINPKDVSEIAVAARKINSFDELNNLDVVIKVGVEHDKSGQYQDKNRVIAIITPENFAYAEFMNGSSDQAVEDLFRGTDKERRDAFRWIFENNPDFRYVCDWAGVDPMCLRQNVFSKIINGD